MGLFDDIKAKGAALQITEEILYAEVFREIESGVRRDGIWAKALSESQMQEDPAKAKYIKLRAQALKDEVSIALAAREAEAQTRELNKPSSEQTLEGVTEGNWRNVRLILVLIVVAVCVAVVFARG